MKVIWDDVPREMNKTNKPNLCSILQVPPCTQSLEALGTLILGIFTEKSLQNIFYREIQEQKDNSPQVVLGLSLQSYSLLGMDRIP